MCEKYKKYIKKFHFNIYVNLNTKKEKEQQNKKVCCMFYMFKYVAHNIENLFAYNEVILYANCITA